MNVLGFDILIKLEIRSGEIGSRKSWTQSPEGLRTSLPNLFIRHGCPQIMHLTLYKWYFRCIVPQGTYCNFRHAGFFGFSSLCMEAQNGLVSKCRLKTRSKVGRGRGDAVLCSVPAKMLEASARVSYSVLFLRESFLYTSQLGLENNQVIARMHVK